MLPKSVLQQLAQDFTSPVTGLSDYAVGYGLGALGQQGMNWATEGSDPNPLISGLLGAPINRTLNQVQRGNILGAAAAQGMSRTPFSQAIGNAFPKFYQDHGSIMASEYLMKNSPVELGLGTAAMLGAVPTGAATSIYNVATDGTDYDNNLTSAIGGLVALAPITYSIMTRRGNK